jgi:hypothetical protein
VWLGVGAGHWTGLQGMSLAWLHSLHSLLSPALPPTPSSQTCTSHLLLICINTFPPKIWLLQNLETFSYMFFQRLLFFFLTEVDTVCSYPGWEDLGEFCEIMRDDSRDGIRWEHETTWSISHCEGVQQCKGWQCGPCDSNGRARCGQPVHPTVSHACRTPCPHTYPTWDWALLPPV